MCSNFFKSNQGLFKCCSAYGYTTFKEAKKTKPRPNEPKAQTKILKRYYLAFGGLILKKSVMIKTSKNLDLFLLVVDIFLYKNYTQQITNEIKFFICLGENLKIFNKLILS